MLWRPKHWFESYPVSQYVYWKDRGNIAANVVVFHWKNQSMCYLPSDEDVALAPIFGKDKYDWHAHWAKSSILIARATVCFFSVFFFFVFHFWWLWVCMCAYPCNWLAIIRCFPFSKDASGGMLFQHWNSLALTLYATVFHTEIFCRWLYVEIACRISKLWIACTWNSRGSLNTVIATDQQSKKKTTWTAYHLMWPEYRF